MPLDRALKLLACKETLLQKKQRPVASSRPQVPRISVRKTGRKNATHLGVLCSSIDGSLRLLMTRVWSSKECLLERVCKCVHADAYIHTYIYVYICKEVSVNASICKYSHDNPSFAGYRRATRLSLQVCMSVRRCFRGYFVWAESAPSTRREKEIRAYTVDVACTGREFWGLGFTVHLYLRIDPSSCVSMWTYTLLVLLNWVLIDSVHFVLAFFLSALFSSDVHSSSRAPKKASVALSLGDGQKCLVPRHRQDVLLFFFRRSTALHAWRKLVRQSKKTLSPSWT